MLVAAFAGCAPKDTTAGGGSQGGSGDQGGTQQGGSGDQGGSQGGSGDQGGTTPDPDAPVDGGTFNYYFTTAAPTVNPLTTQATNPWALIDLISSCLYTTCLRDDKSGWEYRPTMAAEMPKQVDTEGKVWEYKINQGMKWSNGDPITVDDFEFSFKMHADPLQQNLSASSMTLSSYGVLVNIYEYQMGEVKNWSDVGYKKIDDYTFQATFTRPITEFDAINACNRSIVNPGLYTELMTADKTATTYGTSLETTLSCGPFILTEWIPDAKYVLEKNEDFIHADWYHLDKIVITCVPDSSTALQLFEKGEMDYATVSYSMWESYEDDPRLYEYFNDSLMYMFINWGNPMYNNLTGNLNFRQALYYGADRVEIANTLNVYPATRLVRKAVLANPVTGQAFVDIPVDYLDDGYTVRDTKLALEKLDKAYEECGITSNVLRILTGDTANAATSHIRAACEMLQKQYNDLFAGKMTTEFQVVPANQTSSLRRYNPDDPDAFDTAVGSLLPSAKDPRDGFKFYVSTYSPPRFCYADPQFDAWFNESMSLDLQKDNDKIIELCQKLEKKLVKELAVIPFYETPTKVLFAEGFNLPAGKYVTGFGFGTYQGWFDAEYIK